jgi:antitoxin component YwqK of YwqJK toxin-antitoxin module
MKKEHFFISLLFFCIINYNSFAQEIDIPSKKDKKGREKNITLESDTMSKIDANVVKTEDFNIRYKDKQERKKSKKDRQKKRKKLYLGLKTKGGFIRDDDGESIDLFRMVEMTHLNLQGNPKDIHYYDVKAGKIKTDEMSNLQKKIKKGTKMYLLHGHYQKIKNGEVRLEGYYNKGHRNDKWYEFDKEGILLEKITYRDGHTEETFIEHHDEKGTKLKEIVPIVHGRVQGKYQLFHENGNIAIEGKYDNNEKIGFWREWYANKKMKKETMYPTHWYDKTPPVLMREWDETGKLIYDKDKGGKQR